MSANQHAEHLHWLRSSLQAPDYAELLALLREDPAVLRAVIQQVEGPDLAAPAAPPDPRPALELRVVVPLLHGTTALAAGRLAEAVAAALLGSLAAVSDPARRPEVEARVIGGVQ